MQRAECSRLGLRRLQGLSAGQALNISTAAVQLQHVPACLSAPGPPSSCGPTALQHVTEPVV